MVCVYIIQRSALFNKSVTVTYSNIMNMLLRDQS